ncbi:MAG: trypsin-like peptidase domain-containing protein [Gemmataceae bacterium]|nr:trypsin-like peptidase domain-containing protein [Gemmata sp.]MDW8197393.1 trypsin-like peptidase domain-containing protein [Gemmataceae bacterium]
MMRVLIRLWHHTTRLVPVVFLLGCGVIVPLAPAAPLDVDRAVIDEQNQRIATIQKVHPAIVAVCMQGGQGVGSGVLIDPEGYALTNFHVVQPTGPLMQAGLADGVLYDAVVCGIDKVGDVALIKLLPKEKGKPFPYVKLGDSDKVRAGDWSLAMGNPFSLAMDFTPTVTYGIVSGVNRYQPPEGKGLLEYTDCIQIETSINPGNSGGPLFNMDGELIGINGRGSFEKRGRVNSGVGYAISINQIKNFLGHLYGGIDSDHATLGAAIGTANEDAPLTQMVVKQILDESDAYRRGLREGDQLLEFAGRRVNSTNEYKNILGIFPKEWRLPLTIRRGTTTSEMLVRLMGHQAQVIERKEPVPGQPPPPPQPIPKGPRPSGEAAKMYEARKGFSNWYFNVIEQKKLLDKFRKHGDFTELVGTWTLEGQYEQTDRKGPMKIVLTEGPDGTKVAMKLNIETTLEPLRQTDLRLQQEPIGSGGLMMAFYHYRRFLTLGAKGFEGLFAYGGYAPFYPFPRDGSEPKSLAALRVDCDTMITKHGSVECRWYFARTDATLLGFETYVAKDADNLDDRDPCEVYFHDYKDVGGRKLPHTIDVRFGNKRYATLTVTNYNLAK